MNKILKIISYFSFDLPEEGQNLNVYDWITSIIHLFLTGLIIFFASTDSGIAASFCLGVSTVWVSKRKDKSMGMIPKVILMLAISTFFAQCFLIF